MDLEEFKKQCKGLIPVQYCPYTEGMELDLEGLRENTEFLVNFAEEEDRDVVIMTNGSTTEFYANTIEEQKKVIDTVVDTVDGRVPVIAGASEAGAIKTIKMVKYVEQSGADCAMVVLPYYHIPTKRGMYRYYEKVAEAVDIGIMVYNNPNVSGCLIPPDLMAKLAKIDNIVAVKDNTTNAAEYAQKALTIDPEDMVLINGLGELHYAGSAAYKHQYKGFVSFVGNFAPSFSYRIYEAVKNKNFTKAGQALNQQLPLWNFVGKLMKKRESLSIIPKCLRTNLMYMGVGKAALDLVGLNGGPVRLPCDTLTREEKQELKSILQDIGPLES